MSSTDPMFTTLLESLEAFTAECIRSEQIDGTYRAIRNEYIRMGSAQIPARIEAARAALEAALAASDSAFAQASSHFLGLQTLLPDDSEPAD
jgi:hypothetical protein